MGADSDKLIIASSQGYGFVNALGELDTAQKAGKNIINFDESAHLLISKIADDDTLIALVNSAGYLLVYPISELPVLKKGKGNKLMDLKNDESVVAIATLSTTDNLVISAGKRQVTLKADDIQNFMGARGRRGAILAKGFQRVDALYKAI